MIIDFHIHIGLKEHWHPWVNEHFEAVNPELYKDFDNVMNPAGLANYLKGHGVDRAVILAENSPITTGVVSNEYVWDFCKENPMFIPFASIDPRTDTKPAASLRNLVEEQGFQGLKLYPPYQQYFPNENIVYPLYEEAQTLNIPVMIHTGSSIFRGSRLKYANPMLLDDVAVDFPDLKIIMAHSGRGIWYSEAYLLSKLHKNVYMEVSGLPPKNLLKYFPILENNADKVIFGSDWPGVGSIGDNIAAVKALPLGETTIKKILGLNAVKVLGIT
jgi:predicted TIM-barrel fold metal-dependent hydrolase